MFRCIKKLYTRYYTFKLYQQRKRLIEYQTNVKIAKILVEHYVKMSIEALMKELM